MIGNTQSTALDTAMHVVNHWPGAKVLPVRGKYPVYSEVPHGSLDASNDPHQIAAWFTGTDYGVAVTGILAIDCDRPDQALTQFGDGLFKGVQITGNPNRMTFVFAQPETPFGDGRHDGGEIKGSGYIVLPPSRHIDVKNDCPTCPTDHPYLWVSDPDRLPDLPPSIQTILDGLVRRQGERSMPTGEIPPLWLTIGNPCQAVLRQVDTAILELADPGASKHPIMNDAALRLLRLGEQGHAGAATAIANIYDAFIAACQNDSKARARVAPGEFQRSVLGAVGVITREGLTDPDDYGCCNGTPDPSVDDRVFKATPILEHIRAWAEAAKVGPWSLAGSALARAVAEIPPHVRLPAYVGSDASLNLYVALVDASGAGKSVSHKAAADAFTGMGYARTVPNGTGEGLIASFMQRTPKDALEADPHLPKYRVHENPQVLMYVDEIGQLQVGATRSTGSTIDPILRSMWNGEHVGTNNADPDRNRNLPGHTYRLGLVAGVQPGLAGSLLSGQARVSGTAQRWLWLPTINPFAPDESPPFPAPWAWQEPNTYAPHGVCYVTFPAHVREEVEAARLKVLRGMNVTDDDKIKSHRMLTHMKVAAALAVLHGTLDVDDLLWNVAGEFMGKADATRAAVLHLLAEQAEREAEARGWGDAARERGKAKAASAAEERVARSIIRAVRKHDADGRHKGTGCPPSCLTLAISGEDRKAYQAEAITYAIAVAGIIETGGRYRPGPMADL